MAKKEDEILRVMKEVKENQRAEMKAEQHEEMLRKKRQRQEKQYHSFIDNLTDEHKLEIAKLDPANFKKIKESINRKSKFCLFAGIAGVLLGTVLTVGGVVAVPFMGDFGPDIIPALCAIGSGVLGLGIGLPLIDSSRGNTWEWIERYYNEHQEELEELKAQHEKAKEAQLEVQSNEKSKEKKKVNSVQQKNKQEVSNLNKTNDEIVDDLKEIKTNHNNQSEEEAT